MEEMRRIEGSTYNVACAPTRAAVEQMAPTMIAVIISERCK